MTRPGSSQVEFDFLTALMRSMLDPGYAIPIDRFDRSTDRERFLRLSSRHGLNALAYRSLRLHEADSRLANDLAERLLESADVRLGAARNIILTKHLRHVKESLDARGIPFVSLKGPALAIMAYGDALSRMSEDLDIWVRPCDYGEAAKQLGALGFRSERYTTSGAGGVGGPWSSHFAFVHEVEGITVELHWRLFHPHYDDHIAEADLWGRRETVAISGTPIPVMGAEDYLLYLCIHGAKHGWDQLRWVCDVAFMLRSQPGFDWEAAIRRSEAWRCRRRLTIGLLLAQQLLGLPYPVRIRTLIQSDSRSLRQAERIAVRLADSASSPRHPAHLDAVDRLCLKAFDTNGDRLRYLHYLAHRLTVSWLTPSERDKRWVGLPERFQCMYYPLRLLRIACNSLRSWKDGG